jgi:hypothetical protein
LAQEKEIFSTSSICSSQTVLWPKLLWADY